MTTATEQLFSSSISKNLSGETASPTQYKLNVADVAAQFSLEYYKTMSLQPESLHAFYGKQSQMIHSVEGDLEAPICSTLEAIHNRILSMNYHSARIIVESIDALPSTSGGIFLQTTGNMRMKNGAARKFVQSFFLAEQPNGYFVLNDSFRFIDLPKASPSAVVLEQKSAVSRLEQSKPAASPQKQMPVPPTVEAPPEVKPKPVVEEKVNPTKPTSQRTAPRPAIYASEKAIPKAETSAPSGKPGSWASLAAGHAELWKDGVVAPTKAPNVVNVPTSVSAGTKSQPAQKTDRRDAKPRPARPDVPKQNFSRSVYIRNLVSDLDVEELSKVLSVAGKVTSVDYNPSKAQAFVEFESAQSASTAISAKYIFRGVPLSIEARRQMPHRSGSGNNNSRTRRE